MIQSKKSTLSMTWPISALFVALLSLLSLTVNAQVVSVTVEGSKTGVKPDGTTDYSPDINLVGVTNYRWLIEEDATYHIVPGQTCTDSDTTKAECLGLNFHRSNMPVIAEGHSGDAMPNLDPAKHYYLSILPDQPANANNENFSMGGAPITPGQTAVTVRVNAQPIPTAQIVVYVFKDDNPINGAPDQPQEEVVLTNPASSMAGFRITVEDGCGHYGVCAGQQTTDVYGNPLGTTYDAAGNVITIGNGEILTDREGYAVIKNLAPGKYGIQAVPPTGSNWHQTSTIEGTKIIDAWVKANEPGYFAEWGPPGPHVFIGFIPQFANNAVLTGGASITGQIRSIHSSRPPDFTFYTGEPVGGCWVGLNDGTTGKAVFAAPCNADSTFEIPNVPVGNYTLSVWDEPLLYLITSYTINVTADPATGAAQDVALLDVPIFAWFHTIEMKVFYDTNENGVWDTGEVGMPEQATNVRWRDGSIYQSVPTDTTGSAPYEAMFPWFNWMVAEVNFDRFKATGMTAHVDAGGPVVPGEALNEAYGPRTETGPVLLEAFQGFAGQTTVIEWGKKVYGPGENGGISGVIYYDTTRAEEDPRYNGAEAWQPGIPRLQVALYKDVNRDNLIDDLNGDGAVTLADVDNYPFGNFPSAEDFDYNLNGVNDLGDAVAVTHTDSWDDSLPTDCAGQNNMPGIVADNACFDGLRNFNQVKPGVFDGGYAFMSLPNAQGVDAPVPPGNYVVGAGEHRVYKIVKEEDQNTAFGDTFAVPQVLPPVCVGADHLVPDTFSLFPVAGELPAKAGQTTKLCDHKVVTVANGRNAAADFYMLTNVPITGHITGFILDDVSNEFDPLSPAFGEKYSPPFIPVSIRDWKGHEFARTYSDRWGNFNALVPSTYNINVPAPSGVGPNMITTCMNDPGPIPNPNGTGMITDPFYKKQYSQFCYTFPYIPGETTYLDTPVVPVAAFAGPDQFALDCEFPTQTPIIWSVTGPTVAGPWVATAGQVLTITSVGNKSVQNPLFGAPGEPQTIIRDFGFGLDKGSITFNGVPVLATDILSWNNDVITVRVPASFVNVATGLGSAQMLITRNQGATTRTGLTVTVGGRHVEVPVNGSITATINAARPGDLVIVPTGDFDEMVIMSKPVRLQGVGAGSHINPVNIPGEKIQNWFAQVEALVNAGTVSLLPGQNAGFGGIEPATLFTEAGAGVIVMGKAPGTGAPQFNNANNKARIDGLAITGSDNGGGIVVNGYADSMEISNNHVYSNYGVYGGGIRVGHPEFNPPETVNANITIHHNDVAGNGAGFGAGGGISLYTGARGYSVDRNWVCGNYSGSNGGGIAHLGLSRNGKITNNDVLFNQTFQQTQNVDGGGIFIAGVQGAGAALSVGSGHVDIVSNLIQGNNAGAGMGAGIALRSVNGQDAAGAFGTWWNVDIINNMIVNNVAGYTGGGISMQDAIKVRMINNTIARNESTATAGNTFCNTFVVPPVCDPNTSTPYAAGVVSFANSPQLVVGGTAAQQARYGVFSNPIMINNIIWENRMSHFAIDNAQNPPVYGLFTDAVGGVGVDTAVYSTAVPRVLAGAGSGSSNNLYTGVDPKFVLPYFNANPGSTINQNEFTTTIQANPAFDEGGNFINVRYGPLYVYGDYHLRDNNGPANDTGTNAVLITYPATGLDIDGETRPRNVTVDLGADEFVQQ